MKTTFLCATIFVVLSASASAAGTRTIRNETYGFEVTVPDTWTAKKVLQDDPDESMKSREFSFSITTGPDETEPENWNAISFNNSGSSADEPPPVVIIYAHRKEKQTPEEFAELLESTVKLFGGKILKSEKTATGLDYTYDLFTQNRFVVRYEKGNRYVLHYLVPSRDPAMFDKYAPEIDAVVKSLRTR